MSGTEYGCDRCGVEVPDGAGHYVDNDRLCLECAEDGDGMTTYYMTFHYTVGVEATDQETADEQAWTVFAEALPTLTPGDFVCSEPDHIGGAA